MFAMARDPRSDATIFFPTVEIPSSQHFPCHLTFDSDIIWRRDDENSEVPNHMLADIITKEIQMDEVVRKWYESGLHHLSQSKEDAAIHVRRRRL